MIIFAIIVGVLEGLVVAAALAIAMWVHLMSKFE
jgi:hypothetical protein